MEEEKMQGTIKSLNDISIFKMICGISKILICLIFTRYHIKWISYIQKKLEVHWTWNLVGEGKRTLRSDKKYIHTAKDSNILEHINASIFRRTKCWSDVAKDILYNKIADWLEEPKAIHSLIRISNPEKKLAEHKNELL